jgi:putative ABC transport system permease protein
MMGAVLKDIRYALRVLRKTPTFTFVTVATLALGIGATTAIFTVVDGVLLKPLPYRDPARLVMLYVDLTARGGPANEWTGPANQADWSTRTSVFQSVATIRGWNATLSGGELPESFPAEQTTYQYFDTLGVAPELGRTFRQSDDVPNAPRVVILGHRVWRDRFGSDPGVLGRMIAINGEDHEIIGVMPASFRAVQVSDATMWRPLRWSLTNPPRDVAVAHTIARLAPGVSLDRARAELNVFARQLEREHPTSDRGKGINPVPLHEQQTGAVRVALLILLGAVGFVLLIACVNIANLLLARASSRVREIAVRRALGADRRRILGQMLTESLLLAGAGGALGLIFGVWGVSALKAIAPPGTPRLDDVSVDVRVLLFAAAVTIATGLIFGIVPAWHASRDDMAPALKEGGRGQLGDGGNRARRTFIVAELALALMLLVGGGLLLRTFVALQQSSLGFNPDHVLTGFVLPPPARYKTPEQRSAFYDRLLERTAALPGVKIGALSSVIPEGGDSDTDFVIEGRPRAQSSDQSLVTWYREVSASYFQAIEIPLRRGRLFSAGEAAPVAVINETFAGRYWPGEDPLGKRIAFDDDRWFTIVGIVGNVKVRGPRDPGRVEVYVPYWQQPEAGTNVVLKTAVDPASLVEPLKRAVKEVDASVAVSGAETMDGILADSNSAPRFYAMMVAAFAALALILAAVGIYGVMAYTVAQRRTEIGVRLALGAAERQILVLVLGDSLKLTAIGLVIGTAAALVVSRSMQSLLFGVRQTDPATYTLTALVLVLVGLGASYVPARRAMRTDPMTALRTE